MQKRTGDKDPLSDAGAARLEGLVQGNLQDIANFVKALSCLSAAQTVQRCKEFKIPPSGKTRVEASVVPEADAY